MVPRRPADPSRRRRRQSPADGRRPVPHRRFRASGRCAVVLLGHDAARTRHRPRSHRSPPPVRDPTLDPSGDDSRPGWGSCRTCTRLSAPDASRRVGRWRRFGTGDRSDRVGVRPQSAALAGTRGIGSALRCEAALRARRRVRHRRDDGRRCGTRRRRRRLIDRRPTVGLVDAAVRAPGPAAQHDPSQCRSADRGAPDRPRACCRIAVWATANWLIDAAALWLVLASLGAPVHPIGVLVAFGVANVIAAIPISPGGIGIVEWAYLPMLVAFGATLDQATLG
ncbi:MAG: YbhN family protein, partial [Actinomycetota bacterium]